MPRYIHESILVCLRPGGAAPGGFAWQGRRYAVQRVEACWKEVGPWWDGCGERTYFRVMARLLDEERHCKLQIANCKLQIEDAESGILNPELARGTGVYELCYDHERGRWLLETVVD